MRHQAGIRGIIHAQPDVPESGAPAGRGRPQTLPRRGIFMSVDLNDAGSRFPTTRWPLIARASGDSEESRQALAELLRRYLPPLRAHLRYSRGVQASEAEDVLQHFVADKILEQGLIAHARQEKGRFRSFLRTSLNHFLSNRRRSRFSGRRAADRAGPLPEGAEPVDPAPPVGDDFDIAWARQVLAQTLEAMKAECRASGHEAVWGVFEARTLAPILRDAPPVPYQELVEKWGFVSPSQASNARITANRMFVRLLRQAVGAYEADDDAIEEEISDLMKILSIGRAGRG
jgi:DNA-directed RNA polymerase specialized sigma24 family protein